MPLPIANTLLVVKQLAPESLQLAQAHYSHISADTCYLRGRLEAGQMWGAYLGEKLAGFISVHKEGSLGMLQLPPGFRRQKVGTTFIAHLVNLFLQQGRLPYTQVKQYNTASLLFWQKTRFTVAQGTIWSWNKV